MEFPYSDDNSHSSHHRREERDEEYPPPAPRSFDGPPPPPNVYGGGGPGEPYHHHGYPPQPGYHSSSEPPVNVQHVAHEEEADRHHHRPHMPSFMHHQYQRKLSELVGKPTVRVGTKAESNYSLTIRDGQVILASSNHSDPFQHWIKDEKFSTRVKDEEGFPSFAVVNKATGQAIKHSVGATQPANLDAKGLRGKKIEMFDELSTACGNDQATGEWACSAKDVNANYSKKTNDSEDDYLHLIDPIDNMVANDVGDIEGNEFATQQGNTSSQKPTLGKRNHKSSEPVTEQSKKPKVEELFMETMAALATNVARFTDVYEKSNLDYSKLYKAVMDVDELDINSRMTAFEYLNGDPIKARAFLIYPQDMRCLFLIRQLSQGSLDGNQ